MILKNATIHTVTDGTIENGYIIIEGQRIAEVGSMSACPSFEGETLDLDGLSVYPGFIDAHCHVGMWEDALGFEGADGNEITDPVTADLRGIDGVNPQDRCFEEAVKGGVTAIVTGPGSANPIGGTLTCLHTYGDFVDDMIIKEPLAMKMALGENPKRCYHDKQKAPETRMGTLSIIRNALEEARRYDSEGEKYAPKSQALKKVTCQNLPVHIHAHRTDDIFSAVRLAKEFSLDMTLVHATEGYMVAAHLAKLDIKMIIGPIMVDRSKPELRNLTPSAAAELEKHGIEFAMCTDHPVIPIQYLPIMAGLAVREGLSRKTALRSITLTPAKILGLSEHIGCIAQGRYADLCIFDGDPLSLEGKNMMTFIKGKLCYSAI